MFLANYNKLYMRRTDLYLISFVVPESNIYKIQNVNEQNTFLCDAEFLKKIADKVRFDINLIEILTETSSIKRRNFIYLGFNELDDNFNFLIRTYNNLVTVFKILFNDEKLDKLCKD